MTEDQKDAVKITFIGNSGVGKTCIIKRFTNNSYNDSENSTQGGSYSMKTIKVGNKEVRCDLWDTAGQEKFRALGKHFYKDSYIVCLVYDITNRDSFDNLKDAWYPDLQKNGEKYQVIGVVGSKFDLFEKEEVPENEARAFAEEIGGVFSLVSSKTGDGINLLFQTLVAKYLGPEFTEKLNEINSQRTPTMKLDKVEHKKKDEVVVKKKSKC